MNRTVKAATSILAAGTLISCLILGANVVHPTPSHAQTSGITIVALGDSLTAGTGATSGNDWVSLIDRWSGIDIINEGVSGDTTAEALARLDDDVLSRNPDIVIIFLGGNDVLQNVDLDDTIENLSDIIDEVTDDGATPILVGAHGTIFSTAREQEFRELADEKHIEYVESVLDNILGNADRLDDPVHPNDSGYRIIARRIWDDLKDVISEDFPNRDLHVFCEPTRNEGRIGNEIRYEAYIWGGEDTSNYDIAWDLDDEDEGNDAFNDGDGNDTTVQYETGGTKRARIRVESGDERVTENCRTIRITVPELVGLCQVSVNVTRRNEGEDDEEQVAEITWSGRAAGGSGDHRFEWDTITGNPEDAGDDDDNDDSDTDDDEITRTYTTPGRKEARVTISASSSPAIRVTCSATLSPDLFDEDIDRDDALRGSCLINPRTFSTEDDITWSTRISGIPNDGEDEEEVDIEWSGTEGLTGSSTSVSKQYDNDGTKTGTVTLESDGQDFEASCQIHIADDPVEDNGGGSGEGCFIATAAYGSKFEPHVATLRQFRDQVLLPTPLGWLFVKAYYAISPPIADFIRAHEMMKPVIRTALLPAVWYADWKLR